MPRLAHSRTKSYSRVPLFADGDADSENDQVPDPGPAASSSSRRSRPVPLKRLSTDHPPSSVPRNMANYGSREQKDDDGIPSPDRMSNDAQEYDPEMDGKTLFEKKCILVNREMDSMGMGRYQWFIWFLCGFGYLLDLMWAQAFGLVLQPIMQEFGFEGNQSGNITASFNAGLTAGAAFWGILVDIIGRRWAFNLTCLFSSVFGLGLGGTNSYTSFLVLTAFVGFGVGGNIPIDTTITLEFIPQQSRRLLPFLSVFQPIGVIVTTALAYAFVPTYSCKPDFLSKNPEPLKSCNLTGGVQPCCSREMNQGWRYLLFTVGAITMAIFVVRFFLFNFRESPKFLLYKGKDAAAVRVLESISKFNKRHCNVTLQDFEALERDDDSQGSGAAMLGSGAKQMTATQKEKAKLELDRYKMLFNTPTMAFLTTLVWLTYICDYWGFTVAGAYVPSILAAKNGDLGESIEETYREYVYIYLPGIVGVLLGVLCYDLPTIGRKWTMVGSSALMAVSLWVWTTVNSRASNIGLSLMEYVFQSMFNSVLYGWTPEAFPAPIRGTACGLASFWGRLFGIIGPLVAQSQLSAVPTVDDYNRILYVAGGVTLGCVLFTILLPNRVMGAQSL